jgi:hypothetical protein
MNNGGFGGNYAAYTPHRPNHVYPNLAFAEYHLVRLGTCVLDTCLTFKRRFGCVEPPWCVALIDTQAPKWPTSYKTKDALESRKCRPRYYPGLRTAGMLVMTGS